MSAHKTNEGAQNRAAKLVAIMARDAGMTGPVGPTNWEAVLKKLQHKYGEARCGFGVRSIKLED